MRDLTRPAIVVATPHARYDGMAQRVSEALPGYDVVRIHRREELTSKSMEEIKPDFVFFPHWSWLIPEAIHTTFNCVIFHMTDLPYGRGGSPMQNLIVRGHNTTMLSAIKCVEKVDAGPVYLKTPLSLAGTAEEILQRASFVIEKMILEIIKTRPIAIPQVGEVVEFQRRQPADGNLSSLTGLVEVYDHIRMLDGAGYPPAFLDAGQLRFEFSAAVPGEEFVEAKVRIRRVTHE